MSHTRLSTDIMVLQFLIGIRLSEMGLILIENATVEILEMGMVFSL